MKLTEEGYYWATSVTRNATKRRPWMGMVGGYRTIVRLFRYDGETKWQVQMIGGENIYELRDFIDYDGPIGKGYWIK